MLLSAQASTPVLCLNVHIIMDKDMNDLFSYNDQQEEKINLNFLFISVCVVVGYRWVIRYTQSEHQELTSKRIYTIYHTFLHHVN